MANTYKSPHRAGLHPHQIAILDRMQRYDAALKKHYEAACKLHPDKEAQWLTEWARSRAIEEVYTASPESKCPWCSAVTSTFQECGKSYTECAHQGCGWNNRDYTEDGKDVNNGEATA